MWEDLPLEVKLKVLSYLPVAGEGHQHKHQLTLDVDDEDQQHVLLEQQWHSGLPRGRRRRPTRSDLEEVCREWHDLLWQERRHLDLSLAATLRDMSNEEASLRRVLAACKRLETLNLSHCTVNDDCLAAFSPFGPSLRVLVLSSCPQMSNEGLLHLARIGAVAKLERLALAGCTRVTGQGIASFVSHCPMLQDLDVSGVWGFGDAHMKMLVESAPHLRRLNVGGTAVSDAGLHLLLGSTTAAHVEYLGLACCTYLTQSSSQGGIVEIAARCPSLIELDLSYLSQVRDTTLCAILEQCTKLESLNIIKCESINSSRTVAWLKQAPRLRTVCVSRYQPIYSFIKRLGVTVVVD